MAQLAIDLIAEARDRGARAAGDLAQRITSDIADSTAEPMSVDQPARASSPLRSLRREVDLALDEVSTLLRGALDNAEQVMDGRGEARSGIESLRLLVGAGQVTTTTIWVHNTTTQGWNDLALSLDLAPAGAARADVVVGFTPSVIPAIAANDSVSVALAVDASAASQGGHWHGLLLVHGAEALEPLHVQLVIVGTGERS